MAVGSYVRGATPLMAARKKKQRGIRKRAGNDRTPRTYSDYLLPSIRPGLLLFTNFW
jgi:hypothetical protein